MCWVGGLQKQSQNLKTKFTTEGKQQGHESQWVRRERKKKKKKKKTKRR